MKIRISVIQRGTLRFYCGNRLVAALLEQRRRNLEEYPFPSRGTDLPPSYAIKSSFASARRGERRAAPTGYASSTATTATGAVQITVGAALPRLQSRMYCSRRHRHARRGKRAGVMLRPAHDAADAYEARAVRGGGDQLEWHGR